MVRAIEVSKTQLAEMSFDEILDLTAVVVHMSTGATRTPLRSSGNLHRIPGIELLYS